MMAGRPVVHLLVQRATFARGFPARGNESNRINVQQQCPCNAQASFQGRKCAPS